MSVYLKCGVNLETVIWKLKLKPEHKAESGATFDKRRLHRCHIVRTWPQVRTYDERFEPHLKPLKDIGVKKTWWHAFVLSVTGSACVRVGGVFVTCRGPGTTGCRPRQPRTGLANTPGRPVTTEAASETDEGRVYLEITCLPCVELN